MSEKLESIKKQVWTDADFDNMSWHNCRVYAIAFRPETFELSFDIDYVFTTITESTKYSFWLSPATLVFWNVRDYEFSISSGNADLEISSIKRTAIGAPINQKYIQRDIEWLWNIEFWEGQLSLKSVGFNQYIRRPAILSGDYRLTLEERGETNFSRKFTGI